MANAQDAAGIAEVHVASWQATYQGMVSDAVLNAQTVSSRRVFWEGILQGMDWPVFVVDDGTHVLAFCHIAPSRDGDAEKGATGEITAIYVEPGAWRLGHGGELCEAAERELARRGFSRVTLWVLEKNLAACRFYEGHGFRRDGTSKVHESSGAIEVRYGKRLGHRG